MRAHPDVKGPWDLFGVSMPRVRQLGYVTSDPDALRSQLSAQHGVRAWYQVSIRKAELCHRGHPVETRIEIAIGYADGVQHEVIRVCGADPSIFIPPKPDATAPHHVGVFTCDTQSLRLQLEAAGGETVVDGSFSFAPRSKTRVAYLDTRSVIGTYLELIEHRIRGQHTGLPHWLIRLAALTGDVNRIRDAPATKTT